MPNPSIRSKRPVRIGRSVGAAEAKTHFLSLIEDVQRTGAPVTVTKRGKSFVHVVPAQDKPRDIFGCMKGTVTINGDIVGAEPDVWEALG